MSADERSEVWRTIAEQYKVERDELSFNAILLDPFVRDVIRRFPEGGRALDFGAGTGVNTAHLCAAGFDVVAVENEPSMRDVFLEHHRSWPESRARLVTRLDEIDEQDSFDLILCMNVLDHVEDYNATLSAFSRLSRCGAQIIVSVPHPLKDLGEWEKHRAHGRWAYDHYRLDGYLEEGVCFKARENVDGDTVVASMPSHHRTVETYFSSLRSAGFRIDRIREPRPAASDAERVPILFEKCSRIPYFLVFECVAEEKR